MAVVLVPQWPRGAPVEVEVSDPIARAYRALNRRDRRERKRKLQGREPATFSELASRMQGEMREAFGPDLVVDDPRHRPASQRPDTATTTSWDGPRPFILYFVGSREVWSGDPCRSGACELCGGRRLRADEFCLGCERSGAILPPVPRDVRRRCLKAEAERRGGATLRGGR